MSEPARPRLSILAVEDDPILGRFLADALGGAGHALRLATTGADALAAARRHRFDLLLVDQALPDTDGATWLERLRGEPDAASRATTAVAMSGELPAPRRAALIAIGYAEAWQKPVPLTVLESVDHLVGRAAAPSQPAGMTAEPMELDDADALARLGSVATMRALRGLLAGELPRQWRQIRDAIEGDHAEEALAVLHRARAGSALCGANLAAAALRDLEAALRGGIDPGMAVGRAEEAVARVLARLESEPGR